MGQTREQKILKSMAAPQVQKQTPIMSDMFIPNHSGDNSAGDILKTPTKDTDIPNKKYVDDEVGALDLQAVTDVGDTTTNNITVDTNSIDAGSQLILNSPEGRVSQIRFEADSNIHWVVRHHGVASGHDFYLNRHNSGGSIIDSPLICDWATGDITIANDIIANGKIIFTDGQEITADANRIYASNILQAAKVEAYASNSLSTPLVVKGTTSQWGNLVSCRDVDSNELMNVLPDGSIETVGNLEVGGTTELKDQLTLTGDGRVVKDQWLAAGAIRAPGVKPATNVDHGLCSAWQFADAVEANQERVCVLMKCPIDMDRSVAPQICIGWSADGVSPGDCVWQVEYLWTSENEDTTGAAQETLTTDDTASATSNGLIITAITGVDLPSSTDVCLHMRLTRLSAHADDTISDTVQLSGLALSYTSNKLGTAL